MNLRFWVFENTTKKKLRASWRMQTHSFTFAHTKMLRFAEKKELIVFSICGFYGKGKYKTNHATILLMLSYFVW